MLFAGKYEFVEQIGEGAMGIVYRARHLHLGLDLAVKVLRPQYAADPTFRERFLREARLPLSFVHKCAVTFRDFDFDENNTPYLAMDLCPGSPLSTLLREGGPLAPARAIRVASQVLEVLHEAHSVGILHRDIKPDNIMVNLVGSADQVKVLDFGIAKLMLEESTDAALTRGGAIGTPLYMSPEQASGERLDGRSDLYSLGVVLYEMLAGHPPFSAPTVRGILLKHLTYPVPPLPDIPDLPLDFPAVVYRALGKEPGDRFSSAHDFLSALGSLSKEHATAPAAHPAAHPAAPKASLDGVHSWTAAASRMQSFSPLEDAVDEFRAEDRDERLGALMALRPARETMAPPDDLEDDSGVFAISLKRETEEHVEVERPAKGAQRLNSPPDMRDERGDWQRSVPATPDLREGRHVEPVLQPVDPSETPTVVDPSIHKASGYELLRTQVAPPTAELLAASAVEATEADLLQQTESAMLEAALDASPGLSKVDSSAVVRSDETPVDSDTDFKPPASRRWLLVLLLLGAFAAGATWMFMRQQRLDWQRTSRPTQTIGVSAMTPESNLAGDVGAGSGLKPAGSDANSATPTNAEGVGRTPGQPDPAISPVTKSDPARSETEASGKQSPPTVFTVDVDRAEPKVYVSARKVRLIGTVPGGVNRAAINARYLEVKDGKFDVIMDVHDGTHEMPITGYSDSGSLTRPLTLIVDTHPPELRVDEPENGSHQLRPRTLVHGTLTDANAVKLTLNGTPVEVRKGTFSVQYDLKPGKNTLELVARDHLDHSVKRRLIVYLGPAPFPRRRDR